MLGFGIDRGGVDQYEARNATPVPVISVAGPGAGEGLVGRGSGTSGGDPNLGGDTREVVDRQG